MKGERLDGADLRDQDLTGADLEGALLRGADLFMARLDGASLQGAQCTRASFWGASLNDADLSGARCRNTDFRKADLTGVTIEGTVLTGALLNPVTYRRSGWTPRDLLCWLEAGATIESPEGLPPDALEALEALSGAAPQLCLYFRRTLHFRSKVLVEALLTTFLEHESPRCQSRYQPVGAQGALVELSGLPLEDLVRVADGLQAFFHRPEVLDAALDGAVGRAVERALPEVVARSVAPMAVLQAQLGEKIIAHVDAVYEQVERTEIQLSAEVVTTLRRLEDERIERQLDRTGWAWDAAAGRLVRAGGWAVTTGASGNALWAFLVWATKLVSG